LLGSLASATLVSKNNGLVSGLLPYCVAMHLRQGKMSATKPWSLAAYTIQPNTQSCTLPDPVHHCNHGCNTSPGLQSTKAYLMVVLTTVSMTAIFSRWLVARPMPRQGTSLLPAVAGSCSTLTATQRRRQRAL